MLDHTSVTNCSTAFLEHLLSNYDGRILLDNTIMSDSVLFGTIETPLIDVIARQVYSRQITVHGGKVESNGKVAIWATGRKAFEPLVRLVGVLLPVGTRVNQAWLVKLLPSMLPGPDPSDPFKVDVVVIVRNLVDMDVVRRSVDDDGEVWIERTTNEGHPMALGKGIVPRF